MMIVGNKVVLREKRLADARNDYTWESDPELARLDAAPPENASFSVYLADYTSQLRDPFSNSRRFAIDTSTGKHIGNCSFYNISETRSEAELGIMIGDRDYWNKGYGQCVVTAMVDHIFSENRLNRVYLKTLESNVRAQKCFQKCGFAPYGYWSKGELDFILMEIYREQWAGLNKAKARPKD